MSITFFLIVLATLVLILFLVSRKINPVDTVETPLGIREKPCTVLEKQKAKNEQLNFHKAALKARRQGYLRFAYHGNYYPTGLLGSNGGR